MQPSPAVRLLSSAPSAYLNNHLILRFDSGQFFGGRRAVAVVPAGEISCRKTGRIRTDVSNDICRRDRRVFTNSRLTSATPQPASREWDRPRKSLSRDWQHSMQCCVVEPARVTLLSVRQTRPLLYHLLSDSWGYRKCVAPLSCELVN